MLLVVVLFVVAPGFGGGLEAEAFLFHDGTLLWRLLKRKKAKKEKKQKKKNVYRTGPVGDVDFPVLVASPP